MSNNISNTKKELCWKCRYLVVYPDGFFKRKNKKGPCDRCLRQMTAFQFAWENDIWTKFIPKKKTKTKKEDNKSNKNATP